MQSYDCHYYSEAVRMLTQDIWGILWENAKTLAVLLNQVKGKKLTSVKAWNWAKLADKADGLFSAHVTSMVLVPWVEEGPNSIKQVLSAVKQVLRCFLQHRMK